MTVVVRLAKTADIPAVSRYDVHIPEDRLVFCVENGFLLVALYRDTVVGILRYSLFWQTVPFMDMLFVDADYRCKGVGTALCKTWETDMRRRGYKYLLTSTQADESAWRFYEKLGYLKSGGFFPPEQETEELIYLKTL